MTSILARVARPRGCGLLGGLRTCASSSASAGPAAEDGVISFGRYRGAAWQDVLEKDPSYCRWVLREAQSGKVQPPSSSLIAFADWLKETDADMSSFAAAERSNHADFQNRNAPPSSPRTDQPPSDPKIEALGSKIVMFGKYRGRTFKQVLYEDPRYCTWAVRNHDTTLEVSSPEMTIFVEWVKELWESRGPVLHFGKHKGTHLAEVLQKDPSYLTWLLAKHEKLQSEPLEESEAPLRLALEKYSHWIEENYEVPPYLTKGKHAGWTYEQVFRESPDYCRWALSRPELAEEENLKDFINWLKNHEELEKLNRAHLASGKYRGHSYEDVLEKDPGYCRWVLKTYTKEMPCANQDFVIWLQEHAPELEFQTAINDTSNDADNSSSNNSDSDPSKPITKEANRQSHQKWRKEGRWRGSGGAARASA